MTFAKAQTQFTCDDSNCLSFEKNLCWLKHHIIDIEKQENSNININKYLDYKFKEGNSQLTGEGIPWGAYYFPYKKGGITQRWKKSTPQSYNAAVATDLNWNKVKTMTTKYLSLLSPAEKLDIYLGNTDFRITKFEMEKRGINRPDTGGGFCNGARAAGVLIKKEPTDSILVKPANTSAFYFYATDIKALAAASYFHPQHVTRFGDLTCYVQPDIFDITLRYYIAGSNKGICIDIDPSTLINNMTILGYDRIIDPFLATWNGNKLAKVHLTLYCLSELAPTKINAETKNLIKDFRQHVGEGWVQSFVYDYNLEINSDGKIVSGTWLNINNNDFHPDFIWLPFGKGDDDNSLYQKDFGNKDLKYLDIEKILNLHR
jgi:Transglutaminase elicitor